MMGGADAAAGTMCGGLTCDRGQVCCIDCDGRGSCGPPGSICTGVACLPDAGGAGVPCGDILCDPNQTCCGTCEDPFCGPPGSDCPTPADCQPCGRLDEACCTGSCTGSLMCCEGVPYPPEGLCDDVCDMRSDRTIKEGVTPVDPAQILERLAGVPISSWSYRADGTSVRHLGPMAQDFHAAFGLGRSDRTIDYVDASGVALAAIQGLREGVEELRRENQALRRELDELRGRLEACSAR
jgi:hypothetical protein